MHFSIMAPILVLLVAAVASYVITRRIGHLRRQIGALLVSLALGVIGGVVGGLFGEAAYKTALVISVTAAIVGAFAGMMIAWRRRNAPGEQQMQSKPRKQGSRRPHYGISRA
jgi:peptidoglycan/LPS O-acetylase OafA/YrhL